MTVVYLYGGEGTFSGASELEWNSPEPGSSHRFILFLAQADDSPQEQMAIRDLARYGFPNAEIEVGKPIAVEVLNEPQMSAFRQFYEGALAEGSSVVWYP